MEGRIQLGAGTVAFPNGDVYTGDWKDGKKHGVGRLVKSNGVVVEGLFKEDSLASSTEAAAVLPKESTTAVPSPQKLTKTATATRKAPKPAVLTPAAPAFELGFDRGYAKGPKNFQIADPDMENAMRRHREKNSSTGVAAAPAVAKESAPATPSAQKPSKTATAPKSAVPTPATAATKRCIDLGTATTAIAIPNETVLSHKAHVAPSESASNSASSTAAAPTTSVPTPTTDAPTASTVPATANANAPVRRLTPLERKWNVGTYTGDRVDGKRHGQGTYVKGAFTYKGGWENDRPCGHGNAVSPDGKVYEGGWKDGEYSGEGRLTVPARGLPTATPSSAQSALQDVIEGTFVRNLLHGKGRIVTPTFTYEGEFRSGAFHGQGTFTRVTGEVVSGEFHAGKMHNCSGSYRPNRNVVFVGKWENGVFTGKKDVVKRLTGKLPYHSAIMPMSDFPVAYSRNRAKL
jgi:hypothetical protein